MIVCLFWCVCVCVIVRFFPDLPKSQYRNLISSHNPLLSVCVSSHSNLNNLSPLNSCWLVLTKAVRADWSVPPADEGFKVRLRWETSSSRLLFPRRQLPTKHWCVCIVSIVLSLTVITGEQHEYFHFFLLLYPQDPNSSAGFKKLFNYWMSVLSCDSWRMWNLQLWVCFMSFTFSSGGLNTHTHTHTHIYLSLSRVRQETLQTNYQCGKKGILKVKVSKW